MKTKTFKSNWEKRSKSFLVRLEGRLFLAGSKSLDASRNRDDLTIKEEEEERKLKSPQKPSQIKQLWRLSRNKQIRWTLGEAFILGVWKGGWSWV